MKLKIFPHRLHATRATVVIGSSARQCSCRPLHVCMRGSTNSTRWFPSCMRHAVEPADVPEVGRRDVHDVSVRRDRGVSQPEQALRGDELVARVVPQRVEACVEPGEPVEVAPCILARPALRTEAPELLFGALGDLAVQCRVIVR